MISPFKQLNIAYWICIALDAAIALTLYFGYHSNPIHALFFAVIWFS